MARNKLSDLNDHLFAQLERLNDEELSSEQIDKEVERAKAITGIASQIIQNAKVTVDAIKILSKGDIKRSEFPDMIGLSEPKQ